MPLKEQRPSTGRSDALTTQSNAILPPSRGSMLDTSVVHTSSDSQRPAISLAFEQSPGPSIDSLGQHDRPGRLRQPPKSAHAGPLYPPAFGQDHRDHRVMTSHEARGNTYDIDKSEGQTSPFLDRAQVSSDQVKQNTLLQAVHARVNPPASGTLHSSDSMNLRPSSAISMNSPATTIPGYTEHELPPRRELPFKRPESRRTGSDASSSRPGSASLSLPPLRRPSMKMDGPGPLAHQETQQTSKQRPMSMGGHGSPLAQAHLAAERPSSALTSLSTLEANMRRGPTLGNTTIAATQRQAVDRAVPSSLVPTPTNDFIFGKQPGGNWPRAMNLNRQTTNSDAPHEVSPIPTAVEASPEQGQSPIRHAEAHAADHLPQAQESTASNVTNGMSPQEWEQLSRYAAQDQESRLAIMDDFIVAHLNDPAFSTLCQDVEVCWRRVALGL